MAKEQLARLLLKYEPVELVEDQHPAGWISVKMGEASTLTLRCERCHKNYRAVYLHPDNAFETPCPFCAERKFQQKARRREMRRRVWATLTRVMCAAVGVDY